MHALAEKSASLAQQIKDVVAGRTVDAQLMKRLEQLSQCASSESRRQTLADAGAAFSHRSSS